MNIIITKELNGLQFNELVNHMYNCLLESMAVCDDIAWYESCSMDDYFTQWDEIWDEGDNLVGEGLDTISHKFLLDDETRGDFENAFKIARDRACENFADKDKT